MSTTPDLADLRLLVAVDRTGGLGAAAREAGVSQQAVSQRVRALEHDLRVTLVARSPRGSRLTDAGALVAAWSADLLDAADRLDAALESLRTRQAAPLRVAASLTVAEYLVPGWLVRFRADEDARDGRTDERTDEAAVRPAARVELTAANSTAVIDLVRRGVVDLGFVETPDLPGDLHLRTVAHDELVVVVPPGHPWATRPSITAAELAATPLVVREAGSGTRRALQLALQHHHLTPVEPAGELPTTGAVRAAVLASGAPAVLSALAVAEALRSGALVRVPVADLRVRRRLVAVWLHEEPEPHARRFVETAVAGGGALQRAPLSR
ncbi:MAG TPA: LysR family transcriptional regulator [Cellulomonas sp.]